MTRNSIILCVTVRIRNISYAHVDPQEVKLVKKECFNKWYSLGPYYLALTLSRIPMQFFFNVLFLTLSYWLPGLPLEWWRFMLFSMVGMIVSLVAEGLGLAIGATFSVTVSIINILNI